MSDFKLSASLEEHEDDVRAVCFPDSGSVISASRDATVRFWKLVSQTPPKYDATISTHGSSFINAVAYLPPSSAFPDGLIISGGKDTIIEVRQPGRPHEDNAEALLLGHAHNVCALDVSPDGSFVVSGSWDGTARIWRVGKWECEAVLEGHNGSVWTVLALDSKTIVTGSADKLIRVFDIHGKAIRVIRGSTDVVRALCRLPRDHGSGAEFASAGNDGIIRLWTINGQQLGQLHGHENFIYSLVSLPNGGLASSGEDRTVRIWDDSHCIQTITHPAISVWSVSACAASGDIVSGASDRVVRVFTRAKEREAEPAAVKAFEDSVKSSSIPQQQVGAINKEKLPGPEFLQQRSGTKEGQVQMIQEPDGSITAHQWSQGSQSWMSVGTVVDAVGSSGKKTTYLGKDYDFVFDVDIEDGKPPLKLPYNLSQNPYEAATKFIQDNELPMTYLDEVANFITKNTQGATLGQQEQAGGDPWGTGARYRPGDANTVSPPSAPPNRLKVLPQTAYLSIKTANLRTILKKISELNQQLIDERSNDIALSRELLTTLEEASKPLETALANAPKKSQSLDDSVSIAIHMISTWPASLRLPAIDLLRLLAAATPSLAEDRSRGSSTTVVDVLAASAFDDKDRVNNIMLAIRAFGNLFETGPGRRLADDEFDKIHSLVKDTITIPGSAGNRNLVIAVTTLYLNYAVLFTSSEVHKSLPSSLDRALLLLDDLNSLLTQTIDSEAAYRALVALGTLLALGEEVDEAARNIYNLEATLKRVESTVKETRIQGITSEIRELIKS